MPFLELQNVSKSYGTGSRRIRVLRDVNLSIEEGELVALVGFSGSGKTTLLSTIAGLSMPDSGVILLDGKHVEGAGPDRGVVSQSCSLMPWLTVYGNVALAVDAVFEEWDATRRHAHTLEHLDRVGLAHAVDLRPAELSGGMRQRVALARALAMNPEVLLLDEPLSSLDALTRAQLQREIEAIRIRQGTTVILATNDIDEALLLADRIIALEPGPRATLSREFKVAIARPRDRAALNRSAEYQRLRAEITECLAGTQRLAASTAGMQPPDIVPITASRAARAATKVKPARNVDKFLELYEVTKIYPTPRGPLTAVDKLTLDIKQGELVSLIGHSGCGKSTLLSMIAGVSELSSGGIVLDGREIASAGPDRAVVFQTTNLLPWLSARQNVAIGVDRVYPHATVSERRDIVEYYLARVGLGGEIDRKASELSEGMKQRVGLARAFALSPKLLLLDEPFGMLDALTRWELQDVLMELWKRNRITAICATHDVDEAILLADRVVMMTSGPQARIGNIMHVDLPRPRTREALLAHPKYYAYREELIGFLEKCGRQHAVA